MSLSAIMAFNSAIGQMQQNQQNSANIDTARANLEQKQEELDILKRTKESQINLANDQNQLSDYQTKYMMNFYKNQFKNANDYLDATGDAQDLAQHKLNQQNQQLGQVAQTLHATDPDVQQHVGNLLQGMNAARGNGAPISTKQAPSAGSLVTPTLSAGAAAAPSGQLNSAAPNPIAATAAGSAASGVIPSIFPTTGNASQIPDKQTLGIFNSPQSSPVTGSPQGMDAQARAGGVQAPQQGMNIAPEQVQSQQQPDIAEERANYDTSPITAASIAQESTVQNPEVSMGMQSGNPFLMQGAMKEMQEGKGFVTEPGGVDIEKEKNPFFLNQWQQHILNDNTKDGPVIDNYIKKYGLNQTLNQLPATVSQPAMLAAKYRQDPNNLSSTMGGGAQRRQMATLIHAINPDWSEVKYAQIKGNIEQYLDPNTANGKALSALSQVGLHLNTLDKAMTALNSTQYRNVPLFNKTADWWRQNASANPQLASVQVAMSAVHNEVTSAWAGSHNSDAKKAEWDKAISSYASSGDWPALRSTIATLLNEAAENREDQFEGLSNGMSLKDYRGFGAVPPGQKAILDRLQNSNKNSQTSYQSADGRTFTDDDINHTLQLHPEYTREKLLQKLGVNQ